MPQTCSKCSRVNPAEASYCYYDGMVLGGNGHHGAYAGPINTGTQPFHNQFVFPTGQVCRNFDQLALACHENWSAAAELLRQGYLETFLGGLGRADLAQAAREAARFPDPTRGLDQLLSKLPSEVLEAPKLDIAPRQVNLGLLTVGEDRQLELHLANHGMRLLYGSVACDDCVWLAVGEPPGAPQKLFQFDAELVIPVQVRGKELRAGNKPLEGRLVVESNGGTATMTVRAEVPVTPYPDGVLAGARSPRQVAEKAKASPKKAAVLFEKGAVAEWYTSNGWKYPVQGPAASGLGAVQQFFEALGLTPPPKVDISERSVTLRGTVGDSLQHALQVQAQEKRPVYAHGSSDQPWLEVGRPRLNGRTATIPLSVPSVPDREGETLHAKVVVRANGNQRFVVPVTLEVGGSFKFDTGPPPVAVLLEAPVLVATVVPARPSLPAAAAPPVIVHRAARPSGVGWVHAVPAALLAVALLFVVIYDLVNPVTWQAPEGGPKHSPAAKIDLFDTDPHIAVQFNRRLQRFGILMTREKDPNNADKKKRLTFDESGGTNNTCVKIEGYEYLFGLKPGDWAHDKKHGLLKEVDLDLNELQLKQGRGWMSVMDFPERVRVTQTVMIVANAQSKLLDTCLIHYQVENRSTAPHNVGIRVLLDTFIGANDGVPFTIPGQPGLLDTWKKFGQKEIPDYIQALEYPDLKKPGTIARMGLKLPWLKLRGEDDPDPEPVQSLLICHWPDQIGSEVKWDWKPRAMNDPPEEKKDSCVTLYWPALEMPPSSKRVMAFTYGLGRISSTESQNSELSISAGGDMRPGGVFTVTAYVKNPKRGQKVNLDLPSGLTLEEGKDAEQVLDKVRGDYTQVSWRVRAGAEGEHKLTVTSGDLSERYTVRIQKAGLFD
ncbi:MAG TPA: hypothetical protein VG013_38580 [Gemmataceae bacterium]|nr:hypothetical protein [Gemmataceae bacterium]